MNRRKKNWKTSLFIIVMLLIPMSNFIVFWLGVNFNSILMAFQNHQKNWIGLGNFKLVIDDLSMENSSLLPALKNTMIFFMVSLVVILPLSIVLCYFMYKEIKGFKFFRFVFYLPCILSASVLAILFKYIVIPEGPLGVVISKLGIEPLQLMTDSRYALKTLLFYNIFFSLGGNMILLSGAMTHINKSVIEAAQLDGVGMVREMVQIIIPLIWPTLTSLIIFNFVGLFSASGPVLFFTKGEYGTNTIAYWIFNQVYSTGGNHNYASAVGLICTIIATPIALVIRWILNKTVEAVEQ